jgi:tetratricopeptide (TPR) repeat protein
VAGRARPATSGCRDLHLRVRPDDHGTFASLRSILDQVSELAWTGSKQSLAELRALLSEAGCSLGPERERSHARLLADSVTFAITRRVSRESVYTSRLIDRAAHFLNAELSHILRGGRAYVPHVDRLDRPTLKVLARAMLLLDSADELSWVWHSAVDPTSDSQPRREDLYLSSRGMLLRQLVGIVRPTIQHVCQTSLLNRPNGLTRVSGTDISIALVLQNYDACFLWSERGLGSSDLTVATEALRILGLAAINVGRIPEALERLAAAEHLAPSAGLRAHLTYLQGLVEAKRVYDLRESDSHYERGLRALEAGPFAAHEDGALEHAWILNGLALNQAIAWRREPHQVAHYDNAFQLVQQAFFLVREGRIPPRIYLRSNLLANSALLLEMRGDADAAIDLFQAAFEPPASEAATNAEQWLTTLGYRIGCLHYRAGRPEVAYRLLRETSSRDAVISNGPIRERILRALGVVALELGAWDAAEEAFDCGLALARAARFAEGTREHGRGLVATLLRRGREREAADVVTALRAEEAVELLAGAAQGTGLETIAPSPPSPKLPAYLPEIDLEGIPPIDLNRFLGDALPSDSLVQVPWRN